MEIERLVLNALKNQKQSFLDFRGDSLPDFRGDSNVKLPTFGFR
jgi:hypothetical protein